LLIPLTDLKTGDIGFCHGFGKLRISPKVPLMRGQRGSPASRPGDTRLLDADGATLLVGDIAELSHKHRAGDRLGRLDVGPLPP